MAGFDLEAAMNGLAALIDTIPAIESVQIGAPESLSNRIQAWVTLGDPGVIEMERAGGVYRMPFTLVAWMGYVVEGAESAAEAQLGDYVTDLTRRLMQNRKNAVDGVAVNLNGSVDMLGLPHAAAGSADYTMMAGSETRTYPLGVEVVQRENIN
jgi:hypothetical protein